MRDGTIIPEEIKKQYIARSQKLRSLEAKEYAKKLEERGFVLATHAKSISKVCEDQKIIVTVRHTGEASLKRIKEGNPCKGHDILDKSIKQKNGQWTYAYDVKKLKEYEGYVGSSKDKNKKPPRLDGIHYYDETEKKSLLIEMEKITDAHTETFFTGDYDMYDLLYGAAKGGGIDIGQRMLTYNPKDKNHPSSMTRDEEKMICALNKAISYSDIKREKKKIESPNNAYSLFRHGPQGTYYAYATVNEKSTEKVAALLKLDYPIAAFHSNGEVYILENNIDILAFYYKLNEKMISLSPKYDYQ